MTSPVPAGIDYEGVSRYFAQHIPGGKAPFTVSLISGGRSNLTYKISSATTTWVLRRPPLGHVLPTAHDMAREFKVLYGLSDTDVPVPRAIALCEDPSVNGAPFYVMEYREGVIIAESLPAGYAETEQARRDIGLGMIRTLARLHAVDYNAVGLGDFGRPEGYLERQVRRWNEQWGRSKTREMPEVDEVIRRLRNAIPESPAPTIVHGDYRLGNMMMAYNEPGRVVAILDWEMATLGDPLSDVGYTLMYWTEEGDDPNAAAGSLATAVPGFATRAELVEEYERITGRDLSHIDFYQVLASYKLSIIVEGIHARYLAGETVGEGFEGMGERATLLMRNALKIAEKSSDPKLRG
jgi:aminoglycoside phosphotransferase (APT) family kinase protein